MKNTAEKEENQVVPGLAREVREERLQILVNTVQDYAILVLDTDGYIRTWNAGAERMKGYAPSEIIGKHFSVFYTQEDLDSKKPEMELRVATATGRFEDLSWRVRKDGTLFWANVIITALRDSTGKLVGFGKVTRDLTEQKIAQEAIRQSEEKFRLLVDNVRDYAIFMLDTDGKISSWNQGAQRITGYVIDEVLGKHFSIFYPKEDVLSRKPQYELKVAQAEGKYEEEGWRVRKDGTMYWSNVVITALRDETGRLRGYGKVTRDLSARRQAEEALRQSQERFRLMVNSVRDYAIMSLDPRGRIMSWNMGAQRILGYTEDDAIGMHFSTFYTPEDLGSEKPEIELRTASDQGRFEDESWRVRKDGTRFWANVVVTAMRDEMGILRGFTKVTRDMTDRKAAEDQLRRASEALIATNRELEAFSYAVSHDLRSPLRGIDGFSQALIEDYSQHLDQEGQQYLRYIREGTQRMGKLIDDLLNLSKMTRLEMKIVPVNLSSIAKRVLTSLQMENPSRKVETHVQDEIEAHGDPGLLTVVLENLLGNAWKFTSKTENARIEFGVSESVPGKRIYYVRDNGAGFDMKFAEKLFGAFQRLHTPAEFTGTGIGLATVRRVINRHGGEIWAEAQVGKGATFFFTL